MGMHIVRAAHGRLDLSTTLGAFRNFNFCAVILGKRIVDQFRPTLSAGETFHSHSTIMTLIFHFFLLVYPDRGRE